MVLLWLSVVAAMRFRPTAFWRGSRRSLRYGLPRQPFALWVGPSPANDRPTDRSSARAGATRSVTAVTDYSRKRRRKVARAAAPGGRTRAGTCAMRHRPSEPSPDREPDEAVAAGWVVVAMFLGLLALG